MRPAPVTSVYQVDFAPKPAPRPNVAPTGRVPRVARLLALAHRIDAMVATGELRDLAHAAAMCGVTRPRMTQIASLTLLAPAIQLQILDLPPVAKGRDPITERNLRPITAEPRWEEQIRMWQELEDR